MIDFSHVKARLLLEHPFFGTISVAMESARNDDIESFRVRENRFEYRRDYMAALDEGQTAFALCNAALHEALAHTRRRGNRSPWLWEMACDYAINALLIEAGFSPPPAITYDDRFGSLSAEEIYAELSREFLIEEQNDRDADEGRESETGDEKLSQAQREKRLREALAKDDPLRVGVKRLLGDKTAGMIDWRRELRDCVGGHYISDYSLIPPSKKLLYAGVYLPGVHSRHLELAIAIDSSGSVDEALLAQFIAEIESITELFGSYAIELLVCDDRIRSHGRFTNGEEIGYELAGGGGTDFSPVFETIDTLPSRPNLLLYFTDLEGKFPAHEPSCETVWIAPEAKEVPFGRVIVIKDTDG